jgi:phosphoribosylaminoimidazole carboxylase (NCAIR synthetase)
MPGPLGQVSTQLRADGRHGRLERLLAINGFAFHNYGKEPRVGSKLGHCTIFRTGARDRNRALADALKLVEWT